MAIPTPGPILSAYVASYCYALSCLAVTCAVSAFTRSQVICFIISVAICLLLTLFGMQQIIEGIVKALPSSMEGAVRFIAYLCFLTHFYDMSKGLLVLRDLLYFGSVIVRLPHDHRLGASVEAFLISPPLQPTFISPHCL